MGLTQYPLWWGTGSSFLDGEAYTINSANLTYSDSNGNEPFDALFGAMAGWI